MHFKIDAEFATARGPYTKRRTKLIAFIKYSLGNVDGCANAFYK